MIMNNPKLDKILTSFNKTLELSLEYFGDENVVKQYQEIALDLCKINCKIAQNKNALRTAAEAQTEDDFDQIFDAAQSSDVPIDPKSDQVYIKFVSNTRTIIQKYKEKTGQITNARIDPITKGPIYNPVKNVLCGHIYGKDSIMEIMSQNQRTRCPYVGCPNKQPIREQDLEDEGEYNEDNTQDITM